MRAYLLAVILVGCAHDFADLTPFPCPDDGRCPSGLSCIPDEGCAPSRADAPCPREGVCNDDMECWQSMCEPPCPCEDGRTCVANVCLLDCTGSGPCPSSLECKSFDEAGIARVCMPSYMELPACDSVTIGLSCLVCGADNFTVECAGGDYCAANSTCTGTGTCSCVAGWHLVACDGSPCSSDDPCPYPDWHCVPNLWSMGCDDTTSEFEVTCHCKDGATINLPCAGGSCENACL